MSNSVKSLTAALIALAIGSSLSLGPTTAHADVHCSIPQGGTRPICINAPPPGAVVGGVIPRSPQQAERCYYLPTVANGAVNGLRKVCE